MLKKFILLASLFTLGHNLKSGDLDRIILLKDRNEDEVEFNRALFKYEETTKALIPTYAMIKEDPKHKALEKYLIYKDNEGCLFKYSKFIPGYRVLNEYLVYYNYQICLFKNLIKK